MAELILTEEEKTMDWADLPNETIGMIMKRSMFIFEANHDIKIDRTPWYIKLGLIFWAVKCVEQNATEASANLEGVTNQGHNLGDWEIFLRRVDAGKVRQHNELSQPEGDSLIHEFTIRADDLAGGTRISSAWALIMAGLRCLSFGRMGIVVTKSMKLTGVRTVRGPGA